jgi:ribosomal-protein-alanine N-acetyltransferase
MKLINTAKNIEIKCRNIIIRPITCELITSKYLSWLNDSDINQYLEIRNTISTNESVIDYINQTRKKDGCEFFAILVNGTEHIGNINLTCFNPNSIGYAQYGLMIGDKRAQNLGIGGLASIMIAEYLFSYSEIRKIEHFPISANERSWKTAETLGYIREGALRQHDKLSNGEYTDTFIYGMFKTEWLIHRNKFSSILKNFQISKF